MTGRAFPESPPFRAGRCQSFEDAGRLAGGHEASGTTVRSRRDEWIHAGICDVLVTETLAGDDRMVGVVRCDVALDAIPWSRASGSTTARWHGTGDGGGIWAQQVSHASLADRDEAAARLAALACAAPAAMVCLVGEEHLWVKAGYGLRAMSSHPPRANSPCSDTVALESTLVVEDAASDEAYTDSLFVLGGPKIRAYAGVPLVGRDGLPLGTLCVLDWRPRAFSGAQLENRAALAERVVTRLELRRVDRAMGRDRDALLADALDPVRLRQAIDEGEFACCFPPIVCLDSGHAGAFEALVRWCHPSLGVIPPALFLPAMERTGLMHALGRSVLHGALDLAAELGATDGGEVFPKVAVNVSGTQLETPGFADEVAEALSARNLPAHSLCVEVTESVPLERGGAAAALRALGVGIALDDDGAGTPRRTRSSSCR